MKIAAPSNAVLPAALLCAALLTAAAPQDPAAERAFAAARAVSPTPSRIDRERAEWRLERAETAERPEIDARWTAHWAGSAARDAAIRGRSLAPGDLSRGCFDIGIQGCESPLGGYLRIRDRPLMWQVQAGFTEEDGRVDGYVLLAGNDRLRPLVWGSEGVAYDPPKLIWIGDVAYVAIPGVMAGTGAFNADALYRFSPDADRPLTEIDNTGWRDTDLPTLLPPGLEIWKGVAFFYEGLTARTSLWRPSDGNCCPTGGEATLTFEIRDDRLVLTGLLKDDAP